MKTNRPLALWAVIVVTLNFSASPLHAQVATTGDVNPSPSVSPSWDLTGTALTVGEVAEEITGGFEGGDV
jgi:hypothetical protein